MKLLLHGSLTAPNANDTCQNGLTTNSFTFNAVAGHTYKWWLNAVNACGTFSPNSSTITLATSGTVTATPTLTPTPTLKPTNTPTPTSAPTNTPIPTPTLSVSRATIHLTMLLHAIGKGGDNASPGSLGNQTPIHSQRTVSLDVLDNAGDVITTTTGLVTYNAANGNFTGDIQPAISTSTIASLRVKTDSYLRRNIPGIFTLSPNAALTAPTVTLVTGDANNDNQVNILDYDVIMGCYSDFLPATNCTAAQKVSADLNDDGSVNQIDYNLFLREVSVQTGD